MLINLSNHPVVTWSDEQIKTAEKQFGKIMDLPFPKINPKLNEKEVENIADDYFDRIISILKESKDNANAVHVMGELNFTFIIVTKLLEKGIVCIVSTTERNTKELGNKKLTVFNFVRFREYKTPLIR